MKMTNVILFGDLGSSFKSLKFSQPQTDFNVERLAYWRLRLKLSPGKDAARPEDVCPKKYIHEFDPIKEDIKLQLSGA